MRCFRCATHIEGINVEFGCGSHVYSPDGDIYCSQSCKDAVIDDMDRAFAPGGHLSTSDETARYLRGERSES